MRTWITSAVLLFLLYQARARGGCPEKTALWTIIAAYLASTLMVEVRGPAQFLRFDPALFLIDCAMLGSVLVIALRANRFWPMLAAALQLIVVITHVAKWLQIRGMAGVYWGMTTVPIYLQLLVLLSGIRAHQKRSHVIGPYPDWRID